MTSIIQCLILLMMNDIELPEYVSIGLVFTPKLDWKPYVQSVAGITKSWVPFPSQGYLTPETILYLYKAIIHPCMEYCSHVWGGAPQSGCLDLLDRVQEAGQFNWPRIIINSTASISQKSCSKLQHVLQILPWEVFPGTVISSSPSTLEHKINPLS